MSSLQICRKHYLERSLCWKHANKQGKIIQVHTFNWWQSLWWVHGHHVDVGISSFMPRMARAEVAQEEWKDVYGVSVTSYFTQTETSTAWVNQRSSSLIFTSVSGFGERCQYYYGTPYPRNIPPNHSLSQGHIQASTFDRQVRYGRLHLHSFTPVLDVAHQQSIAVIRDTVALSGSWAEIYIFNRLFNLLYPTHEQDSRALLQRS